MRGRNRKGPNPLSRSFESNGPDVKIRGTASHIAEKYVTLARDAASSGDRVAEQNYLQHAEHYFRIVAAAQAQMPQPQQNNQRSDDGDGDQDAAPYSNQPSAETSDAQPRANGADGSSEVNGHAGDGEMSASPGSRSGNGDGRGRQRGRQSSQESGTASNANTAVDEDSAPTSSDD